MRFTRPRRRSFADSIVPMINVVFLLLIFFMMSARIAPAPPFQISVPIAESGAARLKEDATLYVSAQGTIAFQGALDADAWAALQSRDKALRLTIRADAALPTPKIAKIMAQLAQIGIESVDLAIGTP